MMSIKTAISPRLQPLLRRAVQNHGARPMTVLSKTSAEEYKKQNYTERMARTGRPVSPHVTIYALPVAAFSSITTRITGVMLSFGAFGIGAMDLVGGPGASLAIMESLGSSGAMVAAPAKIAVAFPLVYHSLGALRHFVWDYFPDKYLNNVDVPKSSIALFGSAGFISLGLVFV
mmetsp:Transcript_25883/g.55359  ORF Transcript_25883/g.55359 Transcript_25883/m.55359 type:complete len:174 (+) Transcript_25883:108-629(+)